MHVGAFGFNFLITTSLDLSGASTVGRVDIKRSDDTTISKSLTSTDFIAPVTTGGLWTVKVPIILGDLTVSGTYQIQFIDATPNRQLPGGIEVFNVMPNVI